MISFAVVGHPETQGSKRAFARGGRAWVVEAGGKAHADWRAAVADAARQANPGELWDGPVSVALYFTLLKPASAPKTRRTWPIAARSGDVDKLARCVLDSVTHTILRDDSQVVSLWVEKDWGDPPGVRVVLVPITDDLFDHGHHRAVENATRSL